jgi:hypothetical protein
MRPHHVLFGNHNGRDVLARLAFESWRPLTAGDADGAGLSTLAGDNRPFL